MKVAKIKIMGNQKTYWLTERQADIIAEMAMGANHVESPAPAGEKK